MPVQTLEKLLKMARFGAPIVFLGPIPKDVPGFAHLEQRQRNMSTLNLLWDGQVQASKDKNRIAMGVGTVYTGLPLDMSLDDIGIVPEVLATSGLSVIRRKIDGGHLYFVANLTADPVDAYWPLGTPAAGVVWLDPLRESSALALTRSDQEGKTEVRIALQPGESCFLRTRTETYLEGFVWPYLEKAGDPVPLTGEWHVTFDKGGPVLPQPYTTTALSSWTNAPDEEAKRFGGTATYTLTFDAPATQADNWRLDLGKVCESARVTLNGEFVGGVWSLPSHLTLNQPLKPTDNVLSVAVTNLAANRIADMDRRKVEWKIFHDTNVVNILYKAFDASGWPLMDSGLLGPVQLVPLKATP
tara:strand:- start:231 stop:1301 length:1071 start_codon:yes stop_codon:yes gene_type:complete